MQAAAVIHNGSGRPAPPPPVSFEQYLDWIDEDTRAEWVAGAIVPISPANVEHLALVGFLFRLIADFVEAHDLGLVFLNDLLLRLEGRPSGRVPDIAYLRHEHADRLKGTYLDGPADLVVEIVSPDSTERDRGEKFAEYEAAGIPEYWLLDIEREEAAFYQLDERGRYRRREVDAAGFYRSQVLPGFQLAIAWLWARPLPRLAAIRRQLGL